MRILFVLPCFPYPAGDGGRAKIFNVFRYLSSRHECDLICFGAKDNVVIEGFRHHLPSFGKIWVVPQPSLLTRLASTLVNLLRLNPPSFARYSSSPMAVQIRTSKRLRQYDVIHYDIINMAPYLRHNEDVPSVHSPNDATSLVYSRRAEVALSQMARLRLKTVSWLLRRYEQLHYANFTKIHVVSEADREYLAEVSPRANISVIPISSGYSIDISQKFSPPAETSRLVVTVCGNLGDSAISAGFKEFLSAVLPSLSATYPHLEVRVLGRSIEASLQEELKQHPNIEYFAWVEDFEEFLASSHVLFIPDLAGAPGAKTRTVQAMAIGRAVIGSEVAFEGIEITQGTHGAVYKSSEECLKWFLLLLGNSSLRTEMGRAAALQAGNEYSLERIGPIYEAMYAESKASFRPREDSR